MSLEEKLAGIDDITDTEAFNELLMYVEQLQAEDENFMEILLSRLNEMVILWEQPWYQQSNSLTRQVKDTEKFELENFQTGSMSKHESDRIHKNWKKLRKLYNLPKTPICLARWKNTSKSRNPKTPEECARRFVTAFLAQGLERNLHQVYKHFVTRYAYQTRGYYSKWEEKVISISVYHIPKNPVPFISFVLGREPRGIYKRIQQMYNEPKKWTKIKWTLPLATKFVKLLMQYTGEPLVNLKNKRFEMAVWLKLQDDMEQHYMKLQRFWYFILHVQLFVKCDIKKNKLRKKVFKILRNYPYKVWSDIRWKEILTYFKDGFTTYFLYKLCYNIIVKKENYLRTPLEELIPYALDTIKKYRSKRLRTLILDENQELQETRYSNNDFIAQK